jgi:hypothetical protein
MLKHLKYVSLIGLVVLICVFLVGLTSRSVYIPLDYGGVVRIKSASTWGKFNMGRCTVLYQPKGGISGTIAFTDSWWSFPYLVVPSKDGKVLLCLYDLEDMGLWLVKIDTTKNFKPFPAGSHFYEIVQFCPWEVEQGNLEDWKRMYAVLNGMSPDRFKRESVHGLDFGFYRLYRQQKIVLNDVKARVVLLDPSFE